MTTKHSVYSVSNHFPQGFEKAKKLYDNFETQLTKHDSRIKIDPKKRYIGFKIGDKVVVAISPLRSKIKLQLYRVEPKDLIDSRQQVNYKTNSFEDFNKHISTFDINSEDDIEYALDLTNQVILKFFKQS